MNNDILLSTKFRSIGEDATVSMPSQIKALFGMNPQIDVRLIDYDYIGDAKDDDYTRRIPEGRDERFPHPSEP